MPLLKDCVFFNLPSSKKLVTWFFFPAMVLEMVTSFFPSMLKVCSNENPSVGVLSCSKLVATIFFTLLARKAW
jgi:hypothetical protein